MQLWRAADKIVYSRSLDAASSARTRIERDFDPRAILAMKNSLDRDLTIGGPNLAAQAFRAEHRFANGVSRYSAARGRAAGAYANDMPMPKRASVDDFFAQLNDVQRSHLEALRVLSLAADPEAREELKWNLPVYVRGENTNLWMLQSFKNHCSLRFSPPFFATQKAAVEAAGYEAGEGFIKLPYDRELPTGLLKALMQARVEEYETSGAGQDDC